MGEDLSWPGWVKDDIVELLEAQGKWLQYNSGPIERYTPPVVTTSDDRKYSGFGAIETVVLDETQRFYNETRQLDMKRFETDPMYRQEIRNHILTRMIENGQ